MCQRLGEFSVRSAWNYQSRIRALLKEICLLFTYRRYIFRTADSSACTTVRRGEILPRTEDSEGLRCGGGGGGRGGGGGDSGGDGGVQIEDIRDATGRL